MTAYARAHPIQPRAPWVALLFVTLAGLFAVHGLDSHGTTTHTMPARSVILGSLTDGHGSSTSADQPAGDAHATTGAGVAMGASRGVPDTGQPAPDGVDFAGMIGLCLAVLASVLLATGWLWRCARPYAVLPRPYRAACSIVRSGRGRPPPPLTRLSIRRC